MLPMKRTNIVITRMELVNKHIAGTFQLNHKLTRHTGKLSDQVYYTNFRFGSPRSCDTVYLINIVGHMRGIFEFHVWKENRLKHFKKMRLRFCTYLRATINRYHLAMISTIVIPYWNEVLSR